VIREVDSLSESLGFMCWSVVWWRFVYNASVTELSVVRFISLQLSP